MELSYWEHKAWFSNVDFTVIGSGIVGLNCAIALKDRYPKAKVLVLERGSLPQGASTKNAGFACFGSLSEIVADLKYHSEQEVYDLVEQRWQGIRSLRSLLGDEALSYQNLGGHELFLKKDTALFESCSDQLDRVNGLLEPIFGQGPFNKQPNRFSFEGVLDHYISHHYEGQIDTGQMMQQLLLMAQRKGILLLNRIEVTAFEDLGAKVAVQTEGFDFETGTLCVATNGFAQRLLNETVDPARAQGLITEPIANLHIKGTFHFDEGYYYFRNIDDRILFGGGRNLDFEGETTDHFGQTEAIQAQLERLLRDIILPNNKIAIDQRWSGIMGVGTQKKPIIKALSNRVFCGVRLGGMGVAIGSHVGQQLAQLANKA